MSRDRRVTGAGAERVLDGLSDRDQRIVGELARLRVMTAAQLQRLCFQDLGGQHRDRSRRRVLARLVDLGVLSTMERRIGGVRAGSSGLVFVLDVLGQRLATLLDRATLDSPQRTRRPGTVTERFLLHSLAVSELYLQLREATAAGAVELLGFASEPASWWTDSQGRLIKPDASLTLATATVADDWAIEVDRATESLPTVRAKLATYVELLEQGDTGPNGALPRVLVTVPEAARQQAVATVIRGLPPAAEALLHVVPFADSAAYLLRLARE
jgi:hypothetical protein